MGKFRDRFFQMMLLWSRLVDFSSSRIESEKCANEVWRSKSLKSDNKQPRYAPTPHQPKIPITDTLSKLSLAVDWSLAVILAQSVTLEQVSQQRIAPVRSVSPSNPLPQQQSSFWKQWCSPWLLSMVQRTLWLFIGDQWPKSRFTRAISQPQSRWLCGQQRRRRRRRRRRPEFPRQTIPTTNTHLHALRHIFHSHRVSQN